MMIRTESATVQWIELARLLRMEWSGDAIDRARALSLARTLLPHFPELRNTLTHIQRRLSGETLH